MDVVRVFNNELSSLYEVKPPISKAKMTQITKSAIKGIKFYKHIVQSVEKFIQKCRPEYKVPGLYVVDSIVRQSRHQFGADKDVFAPRFTKNINLTFMNLFKCAEEDRPKIVRVLNLWQKNSVFASDVVQPLMDMANPNVAVNDIISQPPVSESGSQNLKSKSSESTSWKGWPQNMEESTEDNVSFPEVSMKNSDRVGKSFSIVDNVQLSQSKPKNSDSLSNDSTVKFNKKLLDFDYGDEEDEEEVKTDDVQLPTVPNPLALSMAQEMLSNPDILRQLQQTFQQNEVKLPVQLQLLEEKEDMAHNSPDPPDPVMAVPTLPYSDPTIMPYTFDSSSMAYVTSQPSSVPLPEAKLPMEAAYQLPMLQDEPPLVAGHIDGDERLMYSMPGEPPLPLQDLDERALVAMDERARNSAEERIQKGDRSRSHSGSRSRGRSGRHRSRSRSPRRRKSRSRSRTRRNHSRTRERDRLRERERECEKERKRRKGGIPSLKKNCITVCSTTLWLGHVPKTCSGVDINAAFKNQGNILSIDMIPPRGCAYIVMEKRQDAHRALLDLKNLKLQGSTIKMAWAPGKGVKGKEFKEYWEVQSGVSYIPYDKVPHNDIATLDLLEEGGFIDEDSLPQALKDLKHLQHTENAQGLDKDIKEKAPDMMIPQVTSGPSAIMPNTTMGMPMVIPQMMQPQFGMPLPGLLPPQSMVVQMPLAVPPPNPLMMVQPTAQTLLAGTPLPVGSIPQMPHLSLVHPPSTSSLNSIMTNMDLVNDNASQSKAAAGDATPTEEGISGVSSPCATSALQALSTATSTFAMGPHGMSRPMLPVMPPVSSAGAPIPFPPPQAFGFPPPPLRPGMPNHNMPGVIPVPNSFPWLHKTTAPIFGNYGETADIRFSSPGGAGAMRMPVPNQNTPGGNPVGMDPQRSQNSNDAGHKLPQDKGSDASKNFTNRPTSHPDMFGRHGGGGSPTSYDNEHNMAVDDLEETMPSDFPRDMDVGMMPRFPGPPDFQMPRGVMRAPWMHGPGPRFPRNMHPGSFPPRGGGPMHPRMEMEFFRHQGQRMHMPGPHGQQPMWGGNGYQPPPRNQDRYQNRRDYYENSRYDDEDRERRYHPREDRGGRNRDYRDEPERRNDDRRHSDSRSDDRDRNSKMDDQKVSSPFKPPPPSRGQKHDMEFDLMRLQNYSNRSRNQGGSGKTNAPEKPKREKNPSTSQNEDASKTHEEEEGKKDDNVEEKTCDNDEKSSVSDEQGENTLENNKNKRDRADRKRSRWGRTHSEEREFQQQRINEIEMKFQNYETMHQSSQDSASVNGSASLDIMLPISEDMEITEPMQDQVCSEDALPVSDDSEIAKDLESSRAEPCNISKPSSPEVHTTDNDASCIDSNPFSDSNNDSLHKTTDSNPVEVPIES